MRNGKTALRLAVLAGMFAVAGWAGHGTASPQQPVKLADGDKVEFSTQIAPILKESCVKCHSLNNSRKKAAAGLQLDNKDAAMKGGKSGKAIVPAMRKKV